MAKKLFRIETEKIVNSSSLMKNNTNIKSWSGDLSLLQNGESMFEGCVNMSSFSQNLPDLTNGKRMFYDAGRYDQELTNESGSFSFNGKLYSFDGTEMFASSQFLENSEPCYVGFVWTGSSTESSMRPTAITNAFNYRHIYDDATINYVTNFCKLNTSAKDCNIGTIQTQENKLSVWTSKGWTIDYDSPIRCAPGWESATAKIKPSNKTSSEVFIKAFLVYTQR